MIPRIPALSLGIWLVVTMASPAAEPPEGGGVAVDENRVSKEMRRFTGGTVISKAPEFLRGFPAFTVPRGSSAEPGQAFSLRLDRPSVVFLLVHERGEVQLPAAWRRVAGSASWKPDGAGLQTDRIYRAEFPAGAVEIPAHTGFQEVFGVPHLAVVVPADDAARLPEVSRTDWVAPPAKEVWLEAEDFGVTGEWSATVESGAGVLKGLSVASAFSPEAGSAAARIELPAPGTYRLWVRSRDHEQNPGARYFHVEINGKRTEKAFGRHGTNGWAWEDGGLFSLDGTPATIRALDTSRFFARFDKLVLSSNPDFVPKGIGAPTTARQLPASVVPTRDRDNASLPAAAVAAPSGRVAARLEGDGLAVEFEARQVEGRERILPVFADARTGGRIGSPGTSFFVFLQAPRQNAKYVPSQGHWPTFDSKGRVTLGDQSFEGPIYSTDPFAAYTSRVFFYPEKLVSSSPDKVVFETVDPLFRATITYTLENGRLKTRVETIPTQSGATTVGAFAFDPVTKDDCSYFLLPYYFQARRFPQTPLLMPSSVATMPLVLVESQRGGKPLSRGIAADLRDGTFAWLTYNRSFAALALFNHEQKIQPGIFAPVPATDASLVKAGTKLTLNFYPFAEAAPWNDTAFRAATHFLELKELRTNFRTSLTEAALNLQDLLMDDTASGWDPANMGFIQIEDKNVVSHASPLTLAQLYALTRDEETYDRRMLPTAAFLFSRHNEHFATDPVSFGPLYAKSDASFAGPVDRYGASVQGGFDAMFGGRTGVFRHDAFLPDGSVRHAGGEENTPLWSEQFWAYRLTGNRTLLEQAVEGCMADAEARVFTPRTDPRNYDNFVKMNIPPYFWAMIDLYEETRNPRLLEAARLGVDTLLTTVYLHPYPFEEKYEVKRQTILDEAQNVVAWWRLDRRFRLGFDASSADPEIAHPKLVPIAKYLNNPDDIRQETVPAWVVSPVGITIEQPVTLAASGVERPDVDGLLNPIRNNAEAAYILRLFGLTGEPRYQTYARNMVLGQFSNYPGYYINYLSTTERAPDYPARGPDLSSIYYHHIPVHYAFTTDWLFTGAEVRSGGKVLFPTVMQQGYVWFANRLRGHAPGRFFEHDGVWPVLKRGLVTLDNPSLNFVMAASPDGFHVYLMNEADQEVNATLTLDASGLTLPGRTVVQVDAGGAVNQPEPKRGWLERLFSAFGSKPSGSDIPIEDEKLGVRIPPRGDLALTFPGVVLKDAAWRRAAAQPADKSRGWIREKDSALGEWVQATLFPHPTKESYDAFVNLGIQREGQAVLHYTLDGTNWQQTPPKAFPFDFFVRSARLDAPFQFLVEWKPKDAASPIRSQTRTLHTGF
jgi:hypothetical protein